MKWTFINLLAFLFLACSTNQNEELKSDIPNVIIIFADDLGFGDLSCYGHPTIQTPRLDQMAQEGIRLTSFYTGAPVCTPSRAALLTGKYPLRVGMPGNLGPDSPGGLSKDERTLAEALKEQGYQTAAFGKWHLGAVPGYLPTDRGFDEYLGILYSNDMMPPWVNTKRPLHLYRNAEPTDEYPVDQTTLTKRYTDEAIRFIKQSKEDPFFIYLPHAMPHLPIYASGQFDGKSEGGRYGDVIEEMDFNVGRILDVLESEGLDENTLVVFTSDNGPWRNLPTRMFESEEVEKWHGGTTASLYGAKATTYEGGQRVPAIIRWPGTIAPKQLSSELMTTMDIHATVLDLCGATSDPNALDGKNVLSVLKGESNSPHDHFFYFKGKTLEAVRNEEWKLRIGIPADSWTSPEFNRGKELPIILELFNLKDDPFEQFNRAEDNPEIVERLKNIMAAKAKELNAQFAANADYQTIAVKKR